MFRVIIAGGRDFDNYEFLAASMNVFLSQKTEPITIVCGKARGADSLGERYAREKGYSIMYFPARWEQMGRGAGFIRNVEMAEHADALVAFWDGQSAGTKHMIETARQHNLLIRIQRYVYHADRMVPHSAPV